MVKSGFTPLSVHVPDTTKGCAKLKEARTENFLAVVTLMEVSQCLVINGTSFFSTGVASSIFFLFRIVVLKHHKRVELNSIELSRRYPKGTYN